MKIPPDFEPDTLLKNGLESPPPKRPRTRKCDLYSGPSRFRHVDDHVNKVKFKYSKNPSNFKVKFSILYDKKKFAKHIQ